MNELVVQQTEEIYNRSRSQTYQGSANIDTWLIFKIKILNKLVRTRGKIRNLKSIIAFLKACLNKRPLPKFMKEKFKGTRIYLYKAAQPILKERLYTLEAWMYFISVVSSFSYFILL